MIDQSLTYQQKVQLYNSKREARKQIKRIHLNMWETLQKNGDWDKDVRDEYDDVINKVQNLIATLNTEINQLYKSLN